MHVDGSRVLTANRRCQSLGWAVVACHQDRLLEEHGHFTSNAGTPYCGYHEHLAFVQGVLLAHRLKVPLEQVSIICDDDIFGYAPTWLHAENYMFGRREQLLTRLRFTLKHIVKQPDAEVHVLDAFRKARIVKVKGHQFHPYQERADYLAKHSARAACGFDEGAPLDFDTWLQRGQEYYISHDQPVQTWYAPFVASLEDPLPTAE